LTSDRLEELYLVRLRLDAVCRVDKVLGVLLKMRYDLLSFFLVG
jgi:hypothetical protein